MPGTPRSHAVRAALEVRARAMRLQGASMAEIERATGVPASTLYQWAARGGWRLCDLEAESAQTFIPDAGGDPGPTALDDPDSFLSSFASAQSVPRLPRDKRAHAAGGCSPCERDALGKFKTEQHGISWPGTPDLQGPQGRPPARSVSEDRPHGGGGGQVKDRLQAAADAAFEAALRCAAAGRAKAAREQLLLGQRFMAAAGVAPGAPEPAPVGEHDDPNAELERRLLRLLDVERKRRAALGVPGYGDGEGA